MTRRNSLAFAILALALAPAARAATIELIPDPTVVSVDGTASIDIVLDGLGDPGIPSLGAFDLDLIFDPTFIAVEDVTFGTALGDLSDPATITGAFVTGGLVDLFEASSIDTATLNAEQPGRITLATLTVRGLMPGETTMGFTQVDLVQAEGNRIELDAFPEDLRISVAIPEPSSALVFLAGTVLVAARIRGHRTSPRRRRGECR